MSLAGGKRQLSYRESCEMQSRKAGGEMVELLGKAERDRNAW